MKMTQRNSRDCLMNAPPNECLRHHFRIRGSMLQLKLTKKEKKRKEKKEAFLLGE
jgi:hypothetical protein